MAQDRAYEVMFAFMMQEELDAMDFAKTVTQSKSKPVIRVEPVKTTPKRLLKGAAAKADAASSVRLKRVKRVRNHEVYLMKGGMVAFYDLTDFKSHFGMTRSQVEDLLTELQPHYHFERGSKLPLENVVLASLWVLVSQESYRIIAERFKTSKSVICTSLHHFCTLVSSNLEHRISWPSGSAIKKTIRGFESMGFPGTIGAMDACQIAINKPKDVEEPDAYISSKNLYCTTLLAVCDHECKFTYVNVGHPGSFDDAEIFRRSELYEAFQEDPQSLLPYEYVLGNQIYTYHLIADGGFPLSEAVMTPYEAIYTSDKESIYNNRLNSSLPVISKSIMLLKRRFRRIRLLLMQHLAQCSVAIKACCILHNMCLDESDLENPLSNEDDEDTSTNVSRVPPSVEGELKREAIAMSFLSQ